MNFIIPKIQWDQWQPKLFFEILLEIFTKLFDIYCHIIAWLLSYQLDQVILNRNRTNEPRNNGLIAFMHKGDIINFLLILFHRIDHCCEIDFLLYHMIMLIYHDDFSFGIGLHHIFNILGKPMPVLSLYNCILFLIFIYLVQSSLILFVVLHSISSYHAWLVLIFFSDFGPIAHNIDMHQLERWLVQNGVNRVINHLSIWLRSYGARRYYYR